jgi:hypothetical protein
VWPTHIPMVLIPTHTSSAHIITTRKARSGDTHIARW